MAIQSVNPYSGELINEFNELTDLELDQRIAYARKKHFIWREIDIPQRAEFLELLAGHLERRKDSLAKLITLEMGKLLSESIAEVEKCVWVCRYYAKNAESMLGEEIIDLNGEASTGTVQYEPLGVVLGVMPWNFPLWQVFRFAAPTLMAGNTILLKHASNVPQCSLAIEEAFNEVRFPPAVFQSLLISAANVERVISDPAIKAVSLTGSETAGSAVAALAGKYLKKSVLELGGSDPFIVMDSADLSNVVPAAVASRMRNSGQSCIAAKRFIVHESLYDKFNEMVVESISQLRYGDPMSTNTSIAPLANEEQLRKITSQVNDSISMGAHLVTGGGRYDGRGYGYKPTLLSDVRLEMPVMKEETFGPVMPVIRYKTIEQAIEIANSTRYGLGASIWTANSTEADRITPELDVGYIAVNEIVASDPRLPFGGIKSSGYGRELGTHGIKEFTNVKSVRVAVTSI